MTDAGRWFSYFCVLVAVALLGEVPAAGQVDDPAFAGIQFNFTPPGARSLGLGGAFLAIANDATAAFTNPAGLTALSQREVSAEGRSFDSTTSAFTSGGRFNGQPTGLGIDRDAELQLGQTKSSTENLSFLSFVQPWRSFRFALFRHQLLDFERQSSSQGPFFNVGGNCQAENILELEGCLRLFPSQTALQVDIENVGASLAYEFDFGLSIGVSVNYYRFDIGWTTRLFDVVAEDFEGLGGFFGAPSFEGSNVFSLQRQAGDDSAVGISAGFVWTLSDRLSVGGSYREGKEFQYVVTTTCGPSDPGFCRTVPGLEEGTSTLDAVFGVPDIFGLGIAVRPTDFFTIALDVDRVEYSALVDNFLVVAIPSADPSAFTVDDIEEIHLGFEYVFANLSNPIYLRAGVWEEPEHQIRYSATEPIESVVLWAGSEAAEDETHVSFGVGFSIGESFSIDLAADFSDLIDIGAASFVYRF